jgi:hypothetical protein
MIMQIQESADVSIVHSAVRSICRVPASTITASTFGEHYQKKGTPVVITGLVDAEPVWDLDYLCQTLGNHYFPLRHYGRDRYQQDKRQWTSIGSGVFVQSLRFVDYADMIRSGEAREQDIYLGRCSLSETPLADAISPRHVEESLGLRFPATGVNLWMGSGDHTSCLHYDPMDSVIMQMYGKKQVTLFPPSQLYNLYPFPMAVQIQRGLALRPGYSQVYPNQPDFEAFPRLREALRYRYDLTLSPGDVLFIPAGWWHEITTVGEGMVCSLNRFWHVIPLSRALRSWNKWRIHLGSLCASPHIVRTFAGAIMSGDRQKELGKLLQKL